MCIQNAHAPEPEYEGERSYARNARPAERENLGGIE
jgi:hypothetical protein